MLKLGYKASAEQFSASELVEFTVQAESLGFDSAFISDHFQPWRHTGGHAPFSLAWLGAAGARTSRITLGTSVLTPTFRYHPAVIAQAFATFGTLFPNRVVLGIGVGEAMNEVACGIPWPEQRERSARFREALELIGRLWREERVSFQGRYYQTADATIYDRPAVPVPIYIAASGPVNAKLAGRRGDGFICTSGKSFELYRETLLPAVSSGVTESGRSLDDYDRLIEMKVSFDTRRERALEMTRWWAALALTPEQKIDIDDPRELERLADELPIERVASRWIVSDDPDEHVERIVAYVEMGFNHLVFHGADADQPRFLRLYAEQVLPRLRARVG